MRQLNTWDNIPLFDESKDAPQGLDVRIAPDTQIFGADPGISSDSSGFRHDQGCTAYGAGCQVNEMPVVGEAILAGILAHGRNEYSVAELNIAKAKRLE